MNAPLYTTEILRLAASLPAPIELEHADGSSEQRSPTCGSRVTTRVQLDADGRVAALSQQVHACAFGQASAALVAAHATGQDRDDIAAAFDDLRDWLRGESERPGSWPQLELLAPARSRSSRHGAILLPFRALLAAIEDTRP